MNKLCMICIMICIIGIMTITIYESAEKDRLERQVSVLVQLAKTSNDDIDSLLSMLKKLKTEGKCNQEVIDNLEDGIKVMPTEELEALLIQLRDE